MEVLFQCRVSTPLALEVVRRLPAWWCYQVTLLAAVRCESSQLPAFATAPKMLACICPLPGSHWTLHGRNAVLKMIGTEDTPSRRGEVFRTLSVEPSNPLKLLRLF